MAYSLVVVLLSTVVVGIKKALWRLMSTSRIEDEILFKMLIDCFNLKLYGVTEILGMSNEQDS